MEPSKPALAYPALVWAVAMRRHVLVQKVLHAETSPTDVAPIFHRLLMCIGLLMLMKIRPRFETDSADHAGKRRGDVGRKMVVKSCFAKEGLVAGLALIVHSRVGSAMRLEARNVGESSLTDAASVRLG
eukprot:CAMPEP_0185267474 /NCGR_PEP_ID=MMETSP1359-20130426/34498_1 /TAXON_ID=552665 /ORGANISM="Bigelowiella longifila, Strain CCMP242" /LENGTH=128 /DNA_ID=CAMNT_0027857843 /DNA_START=283 /DNA_END=666 /DNA_ORIENTATION=-